MKQRVSRGLVASLVGLLSSFVLPAGTASAGGPGHWTKLAEVGDGFDTAGMLRTSDGKLHLVWRKKSTHAYGTSTIALSGSLLNTGTALSGWDSVNHDPQLVKSGSGMRLVFEGGTGSSGCYSNGYVYTSTSSNGTSWNLQNEALSQHSAGIGNLAATTRNDGATPVTTFGGGQYFHVGVDTCPASNPDGSTTQPGGGAPVGPAIVTDKKNDSVWVAWWQNFHKIGYWVQQILPTVGSPKEAPGSSDASPKQNNQPNEPVALAARPGGGVYMATASPPRPRLVRTSLCGR